MSTSASSRGDRPELLADPFDKKAWLEGVRRSSTAPRTFARAGTTSATVQAWTRRRHDSTGLQKGTESE